MYHLKKPEQIRVVFDSSVEYQGKSLNRELLAEPDLMNTLLGVLVRFWHEGVAAVCDAEQIFHSFHVSPEHRILRFLSFEENNPSKPIAKFQMTVHLFGNRPSRAVATYGLRKTVKHGEEADVKEFVERNSYVDDGLVSTPTADEVITLVKSTEATLTSLTRPFAVEDLAKDIRSLELW